MFNKFLKSQPAKFCVVFILFFAMASVAFAQTEVAQKVVEKVEAKVEQEVAQKVAEKVEENKSVLEENKKAVEAQIAEVEAKEEAKAKEAAKVIEEAKVAEPVIAPEAPAKEVAPAKENGKKKSEPVILEEKTITVTKKEGSKEYKTTKETVQEFLKEIKEVYLEGRVYPPLTAVLVDGDIVHIVDRYEQFVVEEKDVPFEYEFIDDATKNFGDNEILEEGVKGLDKVTYKEILKDGLFQKFEIKRERLSEPKRELVKRGTARSIKTSRGYVGYIKKMNVQATAYTLAEGNGDGVTSIGIVPYEGIIAVDPRVIPYRTKVYVPGYGFAMAGDTGGAIVGNKIDLFMHDWHRAIRWGRRNIEIYILE